ALRLFCGDGRTLSHGTGWLWFARRGGWSHFAIGGSRRYRWDESSGRTRRRRTKHCRRIDYVVHQRPNFLCRSPHLLYTDGARRIPHSCRGDQCLWLSAESEASARMNGWAINSNTLKWFYRQNRNIILSYVGMLILLTAVSLYRPGFGLGNPIALRSLLLEAAVIAIVSLGQTLVILSGGVDLSLPWTFGGAAVIMTVLTRGQDSPALWAIPLILGGCFVVGLINGSIIAYLQVSPVIVTLAVSGILLGAVSGFGIGSTGVIYGTPPP